jgi:hypothetical protein
MSVTQLDGTFYCEWDRTFAQTPLQDSAASVSVLKNFIHDVTAARTEHEERVNFEQYTPDKNTIQAIRNLFVTTVAIAERNARSLPLPEVAHLEAFYFNVLQRFHDVPHFLQGIERVAAKAMTALLWCPGDPTSIQGLEQAQEKVIREFLDDIDPSVIGEPPAVALFARVIKAVQPLFAALSLSSQIEAMQSIVAFKNKLLVVVQPSNRHKIFWASRGLWGMMFQPLLAGNADKPSVKAVQTFCCLLMEDLHALITKSEYAGSKNPAVELFAPVYLSAARYFSQHHGLFPTREFRPYDAFLKYLGVTLASTAPGVYIAVLQERLKYSSIAIGEIRILEAMLLIMEKETTFLQQMLTLLSLELLFVRFNDLCLRKGVEWEPHRYIAGMLTMKHTDHDECMHQQFEEFLEMGNLDLACIKFCGDAHNGTAARWQLFAIRQYLASLLQVQRRACDRLWLINPPQRSDDFYTISQNLSKAAHIKIPTLPSSEYLMELVALGDDIRELYGDPRFLAYFDCCDRSSEPLPSILPNLSAALTEKLRIVSAFSKAYEAKRSTSWAQYERGVALLHTLTAEQHGYQYIMPMDATLHIGHAFASLDLQKFQDSTWNETLIDGLRARLMRGGELGIAQEVCELLAPKDEKFAHEFLKRMDLLPTPEEPEQLVEESHEEATISAPKEPETAACSKKEPKKLKKRRASPPHKQEARDKPSKAPSTEHEVPEEPSRASCSLEESPPSLIHRSSSAPSPTASDEDVAVMSVGLLPKNARPSSPLSGSSSTDKTLIRGKQKVRQRPSPPPSLACIQEIVMSAMQQRVDYVIAPRVRRWKLDTFSALNEDVVDFHTYPLNIANVVRAIGEKEHWISQVSHIESIRYACLGAINTHGTLIHGYFAEAFSLTDESLIHHFFHQRGIQELLEHFKEFGSFFDCGATPPTKPINHVYTTVFEHALAKRNFFENVEESTPILICNNRFQIQHKGSTVRIRNLISGVDYMLIGNLQ